MTGHSEPLPIEALLAQEPALRSLARHLLRDDHDAQDATQQSILRAIEKPPAQRQSLGAYLGTILRHGVLDLRRGARARRLREQQAARGEALPSASEMAEREQTRRMVAEAVLALAEPYRATVWLRFYEDLPPRDVARRMDVPVNTVRTRLQRAVAQLRSALDQRHGGDRAAWRAALVPLAGMSAKELVGTSGAVVGTIMLKKVVVVSIAVALAASALFWQDVASSPASRAASPLGETGAAPAPAGGAHERVPERGPRAERRATSAPGAPAWRIEGVVRGVDGDPLPRAIVTVAAATAGGDHREAVARVGCDADGRYVVDLTSWRHRAPLDRAALGFEVSARAPGHLPDAAKTVPASAPSGDERVRFPAVAADQDMVLRRDVTLTPGAVLTGRVLDGAGAPVRDARVRLLAPGDGANASDARTAPDGTYVLGITSAGPRVLSAWRVDVGWAFTDQLALRIDQDQTAPDLILATVSTLRGQFVYADGQPVADLDVDVVTELDAEKIVAEIENGVRAERGVAGGEGRTGPDGRFEFRCLTPGRYQVPVPGMWPTREPKHCILATGPDETKIVVQAHRFRIRLEDEQGRRLVSRHIGWEEWRAADGQGAAGVAEPGRPAAGSGSDVWGAARLDDGLFVPRGTRVSITCNEGAFHAQAWGVAPPRPNESDVVLTLREVRLTARLRVEFVVPAGQPAPPFELQLENVLRGAGARLEVVANQPGVQAFRAAPGRYRLEVLPDAKATYRGECFWFPIAREVVLEDGQETVVRADAVRGGRVRFTIHVPSREALPAVPGFKVSAPHPPGEEPRGSRRFTLHDAAAESWRSSGHAPSEAPCTWGRLLPPGSHVLTIEAETFQTQSVPVVVRAGETTDVTVWLVR